MIGAARKHSAPSTAQLAGIAACIDRLDGLGALPAETRDELRRKIESQRFDLVVVGQFKRGKTSLVNALVGAPLLPVAVIPLTSVVTTLSYGPRSAASLVLESGATKEIALDDLAQYVTEKGNPDNRKGVREAHVVFPSPWLKSGVRLIDTPGVGSVYQRNTDVAHRFLPKADAALFLLSVDQPISQAECDFLASVREHAAKIFFVLNKIDLLSDAELAESADFTRDALTQVLGAPPKLFPLSVRLALSEALQGHEARPSRSGMSELNRALHQLLTEEKDALLATSVARQVHRAIAQARFDLQLERQSLITPLEELARKVPLFEAQKEKILQARDDFEVLLGNDAARALRRPLEDDLKAFSEELKLQVAANLERRFSEQQRLSLRQLQRSLESWVIDEIRQAFDHWRAGESAAIDKTFEAFCTRHSAKIDTLLDELFAFAADLFAIPFAPQSAEAFHSVQSHFQYKFWSEPTALRVLTSSLVLALPKAVGGRLVLDRVRRFALESVEAQTGRTRYDFSQRLEAALAGFGREMAGRISSAIAGIETALDKAQKLRLEGEAASTARIETLAASIRALDEIGDTIAHLAARHGDERPHSRAGFRPEPRPVGARAAASKTK